jgi:hypothetical protein
VKPEGFVLWHVDGMGSFKAFDVFVRKGKIRKYKKTFNWLYKVDCIFVKAFEELVKGYKWIGSEDDLHSYPLNYEFPKNFKMIFYTYFPDRTKPIEEEKEWIKKRLRRLLNSNKPFGVEA